MEKQEMEKKFKGDNTQLLQNKFKKSTSEVEKEVIASILQKRGVIPIVETVNGINSSEEKELPNEAEVKNEETKKIYEKIKEVKNSKNEPKRNYHKSENYNNSKIIPEIKIGDVVKFISWGKTFIGKITRIYVLFGEKDEIIRFETKEGKIKRVFSRIIKEKGYELQTK